MSKRKNTTKGQATAIGRKAAPKGFRELFNKAATESPICTPERIAVLYPLLCAIAEEGFGRVLAAKVAEGSTAAWYSYNDMLSRALAAERVRPELAAAMRPILQESIDDLARIKQYEERQMRA
ncbi:MAG: hypothetical protein AUG51_07805 [Acidobacteria bacterium 13_1_20CM_3_53_8]|nr:MAG: hypothetical protein AUG51_07805 [Acidobacteria bacterium 13_1_20CM_3_53_8]